MYQSCTSRFIALLLVVALTALPLRARSAESPQAAAIRLVLDTKAQQITDVDNPDGWWHDAKERTWSVTRLSEPGFIEAAPIFVVSYKIDGVAMATWRVDIWAGTTAKLVQD